MESSLVPDAPEQEGTIEETVPETGDPGHSKEGLDDRALDEVADDGSDLREDQAKAAIEPPFTPEEEDSDLLG
ncbi:MAG: hypothetical protein H0W27_08155 [Actinobacteria bacterium]|nr:hypothetical protein [Actinomycetota bacterium]